MESLTKLQSLTLRCGINRVGVNGAYAVNKMIKKMPDLEYLNIGFFENYVGD